VIGPPPGLERGLRRLLHRRPAGESEDTLHAAYELGRRALAEGTGVMEFGAVLARAAFAAAAHPRGAPPRRAELEAIVLEALSPFEMAHRAARDATHVLRLLEEAREDEARRLARELHDSAGQELATVYLSLDRLADRAAPAERREVQRVRATLARVEEQLRRIAHEFRPAALDDLGLTAALRQLVRSVSQRTGLRVDLEIRRAQRLPARVETALYRIAQEALANVTRHAAASHASLRLVRAGGRLELVVRDDGAGFDAEAWSSGRELSGIGLRVIRERAAGLGGSLAVRSAPGRGTELRLHIPLEVPCTARP